jgi:hypothetical protein
VVRAVDVPGVQLDEAHSKLRPRQVAWMHTACAWWVADPSPTAPTRGCHTTFVCSSA